MAIYKLGDIANIKMCKRITLNQTKKNGEVPFYTIGTLGSDADRYISKKLWNDLTSKYNYPLKGSTLITASGTIGKIVRFNGEMSYFQDSNIVWLESEKLLLDYIYYWLNKKPFLATHGSTIKRLYNSDIRATKIFVPTIKHQQEIIDIIKPIEKSILTLNRIQEYIERLENSLLHDSKITNLKFNYCKGGLAGKEGKTMFLNVASANGNPNRYVNNNPNVFIGDVTLSLDGNCGLVNNCLEGYNGYLYKVSAKNIPNWQVFYSLKTNDSQNIIKLNETGTTIKHASGAKKELTVHEFDNKKLLESLFISRIQIFKMKSDLEKKLQNTIKLLIK